MKLTYTLPKHHEEKSEEVSMPSGDMDYWRRRVSIPINSEIVEALSVGEQVSVTLHGEVRGLSENENEEKKECNLEFRIASVDLDVMEDQEGFERGFARGSKRMY